MSSEDSRITAVKDLIEFCPDFPKPGIIFQYVVSWENYRNLLKINETL